MMTFLVDFNLDGYALLLLGLLTKLGWLELVSIRFVTFREAGLSMDASDRLVWHYAQENQIIQKQSIAPKNKFHPSPTLQLLDQMN